MSYISIAGEKIYYIERGRGIPVVFVHGAGSSHLIWGAQTRALGEVARAIALDLPGHGKSDGEGRDSIEAYRDLFVGFLDALEIERAGIVGHSMGGAIAQLLALSHPDRVAGLGLIGTGARLRVLPSILDGILSDFDNTARMVTEYSFAANADSALKQKAELQLRACDPRVTYGDYAACNAFDVIERITEIHASALIVCGREDRMTPPKYSGFLATKIPNARLEWIDRAGHQVMIEQSEVVNRVLLEFVNGFRKP